MFHWALTAAALLALLYAVRTLFLSAKQRNAARQRLGFGFSIAAACLWVYVLQHHFGDLGLAVRLAGGVLLTLPAVSALASPARANIMRALLGVFLAVLLAGPAVQQLWTRYGPDTRSSRVLKLETKLNELRSLRVDLQDRRKNLSDLRTSTAAELRALGANWAEIEGNPAAITKLELLASVKAELPRIDQAIDDLGNQEAKLVAAIDSSGQEESVDATEPASELEQLRREFEARSGSDNSSLVERHLRSQQLRKVYESELGTH